MAIKKTTASKKVTRSEDTAESSTSGIVSCDVVSVKIKKATEYSRQGIEISRSVTLSEDDDPKEVINNLIVELDETAEEYIGQFEGSEEVVDESEEVVEEGEEEGEEEEEVTAEDIQGMSKAELLSFIKENGIDVNPKDFKKLADLAEAVIAEVFSSEEEGEEESEGEEEGEEVTAEDIRAMGRAELIQFIKDNGIGIDEEFFGRIFVLFQRLHIREEYSGNGIGLAVAKKIVLNMGGDIWVTSAEGKGATFYFTISKNINK